jgi:hypothetical protein
VQLLVRLRRCWSYRSLGSLSPIRPAILVVLRVKSSMVYLIVDSIHSIKSVNTATKVPSQRSQ